MGTAAKENDKLLEEEGGDDYIEVLWGLLWLQYGKSVIAPDDSNNLGTKILS